MLTKLLSIILFVSITSSNQKFCVYVMGDMKYDETRKVYLYDITVSKVYEIADTSEATLDIFRDKASKAATNNLKVPFGQRGYNTVELPFARGMENIGFNFCDAVELSEDGKDVADPILNQYDIFDLEGGGMEYEGLCCFKKRSGVSYNWFANLDHNYKNHHVEVDYEISLLVI